MPTTSRFGALTAESAASRYEAPRANGSTHFDAPRKRPAALPDRTPRTTSGWRAPVERIVTTRYAGVTGPDAAARTARVTVPHGTRCRGQERLA